MRQIPGRNDTWQVNGMTDTDIIWTTARFLQETRVAGDKRRTEMRRRCCLWEACKLSCVRRSFFQDELFRTSFHQMAWKYETQPRGVRPLHRQPRESSFDTNITNMIKINGTMVLALLQLGRYWHVAGLWFWWIAILIHLSYEVNCHSRWGELNPL